MAVNSELSLTSAVLRGLRTAAKRTGALVVIFLLAGCNDLGVNVTGFEVIGEYGQARQAIAQDMTQDKSDRQYMLDRMRLAIATMDDGYPQIAGPTLDEVYTILRTQGVNADKTVASVVINEGVKFWKGEPFEQAMGFIYYSAQQASLGQWDNARAAAQNALFHLKDFGVGQAGQPADSLELAQRGAAYDQAHASGAGGAAGGTSGGGAAPGSDYYNSGYAVHDSNFTLGYLMNGLANQELGRTREAKDNYAVALKINPGLAPLVDELNAGKFNAILVVAYGIGPRKIAYGPDGALTKFVPIMPSDGAPLLVWTSQGNQVSAYSKAYPAVCDLNQMGADYMWNNLEDVREAKSIIGNILLVGGAIAAGVGAEAHNRDAMWAGLGAVAAGVLTKVSAHADTRYCDIMPQRFYLVPVALPGVSGGGGASGGGAVVNLQVQNRPFTRLALAGLAPAAGASGPATLRYVRLLGGPLETYQPPPAWAVSGRVFYANDASGDADPAGPIPQADLPYILGGRSTRAPTVLALKIYQTLAPFRGMTPSDLEGLYRAEGISFGQGPTPPAERHVLEGGHTILPPQAGTVGFARLFGQVHNAYQPQSAAVRDLAASVQQARP
jgi:hypothetical protein